MKKMNTGQTVYEQLQEILNKCIELGWRPFGIDTQVQRSGLANHWGYIGGRGEPIYCSNHDLFSKDSGIMEFVDWEWTDIVRDLDSMLDRSDGYEYWSSKCHTIKELHEMIMVKMTAEEKCNYFVNNAIIPTK